MHFLYCFCSLKGAGIRMYVRMCLHHILKRIQSHIVWWAVVTFCCLSVGAMERVSPPSLSGLVTISNMLVAVWLVQRLIVRILQNAEIRNIRTYRCTYQWYTTCVWKAVSYCLNVCMLVCTLIHLLKQLLYIHMYCMWITCDQCT